MATKIKRHSETLEQTALWKHYKTELSSEQLHKAAERTDWVSKVYKSASEKLSHYIDVFPNYTLHNERHILNVLDAMAGLLGNQISELSIGETELLILSACLHDLGMVYTEKEQEEYLSEKPRNRQEQNLRNKFLTEKHPDVEELLPAEWPSGVKQDYFRYIHPFRLDRILQHIEWRTVFETSPVGTVSRETIVAVCQSHGEGFNVIIEKAIRPSGHLFYQEAAKIDPLFCAILLRLADILDFDDSRAPSSLYNYTGSSIVSQEEWKKHMSSGGFSYPRTPSLKPLPYYAVCTLPTIQRAVLRFLDWIDDELSTSRNLLRSCNDRWKGFHLPYIVNRNEIQSKGYDYGDFRISMDQEQILALLTGENLYHKRTVFVRELLQNAIDATMLRATLDPSFDVSSNNARIDIWDWYDVNGQYWIRIDDRGTGMTKGMLEKYFLKAGSSYYTSEELKRDLRSCGVSDSYVGIGRFGIGFLSCFLCGTEAKVSSLYWNHEKNSLENGCDPQKDDRDYGLRLDVTGLTGYYTLKNQALSDNYPDPFPAPPQSQPQPDPSLHQNEYRSPDFPGTSIAICIDPGKMGGDPLKEIARESLTCPMMPVFYNGKPLVYTYPQIIELTKQYGTDFTYTLSDSYKQSFDDFFPEIRGNYPSLHLSVESFDFAGVDSFPPISGFIIRERSCCSKSTEFERNGHKFNVSLKLSYSSRDNRAAEFPSITLSISSETDPRLDALYQSSTPRHKQLEAIRISNNELLHAILASSNAHVMAFSFHGISINTYYFLSQTRLLVFLGNSVRPILSVSRDYIKDLSLEVTIMLSAWLSNEIEYSSQEWPSINSLLPAWRQLRAAQFHNWVLKETGNKLETMKQQLSKHAPCSFNLSHYRSSDNALFEAGHRVALERYFVAYLQDNYKMLVDYTNGQSISMTEDNSASREAYDYFPPMMFCEAANEESKKILCHDSFTMRRCITIDHPFTRWLLENADKMKRFYPAQFAQITNCLMEDMGSMIIETLGNIREQLSHVSSMYGIDMDGCPILTKNDFWKSDDD